MTTAHSPRRVLKAQAEKIAATLKAVERGEVPKVPFAKKMVEARHKPEVSFGIAMDDKVLRITMTWVTIKETSHAGIVEFIIKHMQEAREQ